MGAVRTEESTMDFKNQALKYFDAFSNKDLNLLETMFVSGVQLRDWEVTARGKIEVGSAVRKIFDSVGTITVVPVALYENERIVIAELKIIVNNNETLLVTDIITFNGEGQITSIRAYKG